MKKMVERSLHNAFAKKALEGEQCRTDNDEPADRVSCPNVQHLRRAKQHKYGKDGEQNIFHQVGQNMKVEPGVRRVPVYGRNARKEAVLEKVGGCGQRRKNQHEPTLYLMMLSSAYVFGCLTNNVYADKNQNCRDKKAASLLYALCGNVKAVSKKLNRDRAKTDYGIGKNMSNVSKQSKTPRKDRSRKLKSGDDKSKAPCLKVDRHIGLHLFLAVGVMMIRQFFHGSQGLINSTPAK